MDNVKVIEKIILKNYQRSCLDEGTCWMY